MQVADAVGLLNAWTDVYRFDHQQLDYFTLLKGTALREALQAAAAILELQLKPAWLQGGILK